MAVPLAPVTSHMWDIGEVGRAEMMIMNISKQPEAQLENGVAYKKRRM